MEQGDIIWEWCNVCGGERKHFVVHDYTAEWADPYPGENRYELLQCAGCVDVVLRHTYIDPGIKDEQGNIKPLIAYYPPRGFRRLPQWLYAEMPKFISRLIHEIYTALHCDCLALAAMGVRAILENIMIDRVGDHNSFRANLAEFQKQGYISPRQKAILDSTLELGHASIHRDYVPSATDITTALDITETLIQTIYVSDKQADALKKKIPARHKKP